MSNVVTKKKVYVRYADPEDVIEIASTDDEVNADEVAVEADSEITENGEEPGNSDDAETLEEVLYVNM